MSDRTARLLRRSITLAVVAVAMFALRSLWTHNELAPWTRDGRVRADVVSIAPDVPGFVVKVAVHDNQVVSKGDALFELDRAATRSPCSRLWQRSRGNELPSPKPDAKRIVTIVSARVVSSEVREQSRTRVHEANRGASARSGRPRGQRG